MVGSKTSGIFKNIIVCWHNGTLANRLRDQEEIVPNIKYEDISPINI